MGWLYANGEVLQVDYGPRYTEVRVRCRADDAERIGAMGRIVSRASVDGT